MTDIFKLVGAKVRDLRKQQGLSQEQLGEKTGFKFSYIGSLERGEANISLKNLNRIAVGLEVSIFELFTYDETFNFNSSEKEPLLNEVVELLLKLDQKKLKKIKILINEIFINE